MAEAVVLHLEAPVGSHLVQLLGLVALRTLAGSIDNMLYSSGSLRTQRTGLHLRHIERCSLWMKKLLAQLVFRAVGPERLVLVIVALRSQRILRNHCYSFDDRLAGNLLRNLSVAEGLP